jgi:hypothetical protein
MSFIHIEKQSYDQAKCLGDLGICRASHDISDLVS